MELKRRKETGTGSALRESVIEIALKHYFLHIPFKEEDFFRANRLGCVPWWPFSSLPPRCARRHMAGPGRISCFIGQSECEADIAPWGQEGKSVKIETLIVSKLWIENSLSLWHIQDSPPMIKAIFTQIWKTKGQLRFLEHNTLSVLRVWCHTAVSYGTAKLPIYTTVLKKGITGHFISLGPWAPFPNA